MPIEPIVANSGRTSSVFEPHRLIWPLESAAQAGDSWPDTSWSPMTFRESRTLRESRSLILTKEGPWRMQLSCRCGPWLVINSRETREMASHDKRRLSEGLQGRGDRVRHELEFWVFFFFSDWIWEREMRNWKNKIGMLKIWKTYSWSKLF